MQRVLTSICILSSVIAILFNQWLAGIYSGFAFGASKMCDHMYSIPWGEGTRMVFSHIDPYSNMEYSQRLLGFTLVLYVAIKLLGYGRVVGIIGLIPLGLSLFLWSSVHRVGNLDISDPDKYLDLIRLAAPYEWTVFGLILSLLVFQIISILLAFKNRPRISVAKG